MLATSHTQQVELRGYQINANNNTLRELTKVNSVMLVAPTGSGKTVILGNFCRLAMKKEPEPYPVLVLAHREELILQAQDKLFKQFGIYAGVIKSGVQSCFQLRVQIASVQTLVNRLNKTLFDPKIIIIDEAHHATAETYRKIISFFPNAKLIGLTATPYRASGEGFTDIFKSLVMTTTVKYLEEIGFLVKARAFSYPLDNSKLDTVDIVKGDYDEKQIEKLMMEDQIIEDMVASYKERAWGKRAICFAVSIAHSKKIVARFNAEGIPAAHMDANSDNRSAIIKRFDKGDILLLSNVGIATEGTDIPSIECVMIARATKSLALYLQICGRGSRLYPNKDEYILLDFGNCIIDHGAPNKEHDWERHFKGTKKKGKKKEKPKEKQFKIKLVTGEEFEGTRYEIPKGAKGVILEEIDEESLHLRVRWRLFENILAQIKGKTKVTGESYSHFASIYRWQNELQRKKELNPSRQEIEKVAKVLGANQKWVNNIDGIFNPPKNP